MSNYCTNVQVGVLLQKTFDATSNPTNTQVDTIIEQITNEIDTILNSIGITSQPTDTKLLGTLQKYCSFGSAGTVGMTYFRNATDVDGSNASWYYEKYEAFLKKLFDEPEFFGIISNAESIYMSNPVIDGTYTEQEISDNFFDNKGYKV